MKFSVMRVYITVEAEALRARHGDIAQNGCDNREINRHASAECAGDVDDLARTAPMQRNMVVALQSK